jgi:TPR repeat protein
MDELTMDAEYREAIKLIAKGWHRPALDKLLPIAEAGHHAAQYEVGRYYSQQRVDWKEAAKWFARAAERESPPAQYELGHCYMLGLGVPRDQRQAANWLKAAAENGHAGAALDLGLLYLNGCDAMPICMQMARFWLGNALWCDSARAAAEAGLEIAMRRDPFVPLTA